MTRLKKVLLSVVVLAALALGGSALANAVGGDDSDTQVIGGDATRAGAAAREAVGGGTVKSVEGSDEGGAAVYEVEVDHAGKVIEVQVDKAFKVMSQAADDDQAESGDRGDGDGEADDD